MLLVLMRSEFSVSGFAEVFFTGQEGGGEDLERGQKGTEERC